MYTNSSLWAYFLQASFALKAIFIILWIASITAWVLILQGLFFLKSVNKAYSKFEKEFWSNIKLTELYESLSDTIPSEHLGAIFYSGFTEFCRLRNSGCQTLRVILEGVSRAMHIATIHAEIQIERQLHWLTIIGVSSPYLGLVGTLLGVMSALSKLEYTGQPSTLLLLAPGISEALMVSTISLLTVLPTLIFYYYYTHQVDKLFNQYYIFREEFIELLLRQAYEEQHEKLPKTS